MHQKSLTPRSILGAHKIKDRILPKSLKKLARERSVREAVLTLIANKQEIPRNTVTLNLTLGHKADDIAMTIGALGFAKKPIMGCRNMTVGDLLEQI